MKKFIFVLASCFLLVACTPDQEKKAGQLADTYAHSVSAFHNAVDVAHEKNLISEPDYQAILKDIITADQGGLELNSTIRGIAKGTSTTDQVNAIVQGIEHALTNGTAHIKDPNTLAEVNVIIQSINLTLTSVEQIYAGGK